MTDSVDRGRMEVNTDECKGCGLCVAECPKKVIEIATDIINKQGYNPARYKGSGCIGCGTCFYTCPEPGAIVVFRLAKADK